MGDPDELDAKLADLEVAMASLWEKAVLQHGCCGCAAHDLESRLKVTLEEWVQVERHDRERNCLMLCSEPGAPVCSVLAREPDVLEGTETVVSFVASLAVSVAVAKVWNAAVALMECAECARDYMRRRIRHCEAVTRTYIARGQRRRGIARACGRCQVRRVGLI